VAKFLQPSLSGGELAPGLRGRVDLARYAISLGRARNFVTKPTGGGAKRGGTRFKGIVKHSDRPTRIIPFIYSTVVKYLIEMGDGYFRFWVDGVLLTNSTKAITGITAAATPVVTSAAHGFSNGDYVTFDGIVGMSRLNGRSSQISGVTANTYELDDISTAGYAAYVSGGTGSRVVEVVTPYTGTIIYDVRFTQSADVLYLFNGAIPIKELRRLTATSFELRDFPFKRGPFRPFNADEALIMAASGTTGLVTVTTNVDTFTPTMVDSLLYMEEKELRGVKPWASAEKNAPLGALRRSDNKVYRLVSVPTVSGTGTPYYVSGGVRPVHESGRAFDGPGDVKFDGVNDYAVGVEWEFLHNTFGILQIKSYVSPTEVTAIVIERLPDSIVGTAPTPVAGPWNDTGDGTDRTFPIAGALSDSVNDYQVTIDGVPIQPNPYYSGGGGAGNGGGGGGNPRPGGGNPAQQEV
jgi:hypothetical protein